MQTPTPLEPTDGPLLREELQLAFRNRGMPLEAMRYDTTPTGLHYLVVHWDIPAADLANWRLSVGHGRREHELGCRATDATGATQPLEAPWNYQGMGNNIVQRIFVAAR